MLNNHLRLFGMTCCSRPNNKADKLLTGGLPGSVIDGGDLKSPIVTVTAIAIGRRTTRPILSMVRNGFLDMLSHYPRFGGTSFVNARSKASPVSSMPAFRAASINRSDWAGSLRVIFGFSLRFGFALALGGFAIRPLTDESFDKLTSCRRCL
jgi:hypothetical protein